MDETIKKDDENQEDSMDSKDSVSSEDSSDSSGSEDSGSSSFSDSSENNNDNDAQDSENDDTIEQSSIDVSENNSVQSTPNSGFVSNDVGKSSQEEHVTISKEKLWKYSTFVLIALVLVGAFFSFSGNDIGTGTGAVVDNGNNPSPTPSPTPSNVEVSIDDDAVKGDKDAPVTIIEFSDYECPFCARFYTQTYGQIQKEYIDTGKVKFVYRDFPLGFHQNAQKAAEAAECAGEQDKYFDMHDKLFENGVAGGVASFKQFAGQIGLNQGDFDNCLDSGEMADEVKKDMADGQSYGVQGTPAFFVNGKLISGAQPFSAFQQAIDAEL